MAEHAVGNMVVLTGTIVEIHGGVAMVRVDKSFPEGGTIAVRLGKLPSGDTGEDRIRDAMAEARDHPGRTVTR
jgi:hypothetical protein